MIADPEPVLRVLAAARELRAAAADVDGYDEVELKRLTDAVGHPNGLRSASALALVRDLVDELFARGET